MSKMLSLILFAVCLLLVTCGTSDVGANGVLNGADPSTPQGYSVGHPKNPETWYLLAEWLSEEAKAPTLAPDAVRVLVLRGIDVNEQALAINPVYYDALKLKAVLLRRRATSEPDSSVQAKLRADAAASDAMAEELAKRQRGGR